MTAVNPPARFGLVKFKNNLAIEFKEKNKIINAWINGGFFMVNQKFIKYINNEKSILEESPLEKACKKRACYLQTQGFLAMYGHKKRFNNFKKFN